MSELFNTGSILGSTAVGAGSWYRVPQKAGIMTFHSVQTGTAGSTHSSVVDIEGSNDGVNAIATALGTITLSSAASPGSDGLAIDAAWAYFRAKINSITTGSSVSVYGNSQNRG